MKTCQLDYRTPHSYDDWARRMHFCAKCHSNQSPSLLVFASLAAVARIAPVQALEWTAIEVLEVPRVPAGTRAQPVVRRQEAVLRKLEGVPRW